MRLRHYWAVFAVLFIALIPFLASRVSGQTGIIPSRISAAVDNTKLTMLRGNTHPLARAEFDRGAAPASLPMEHMMLVLTRSPQQEAALETLLAQQQDRSSPNYHQWLTPQQFGQQFGPSDQDIQTITAWLQSNGFQVNNVANGRTTIDFSGTAGAVQQAFHAAIHSYVLANGEQHWANSSDPQIPTALAAVVAGVGSLNNFRKKPFHTSHGAVRRDMTTGKFTRINPQFTFAGASDGFCSGASGTNNCWAVGPGDFDLIYNVPSTATGTGQTIAIVSDSDIYASDVTSFRSIFSLPTATISNNNSPACPASGACFDQIETGTDPGVQGPRSSSADEEEAVLDVEWAGGVAQNATIDLVVSPTTGATFGGDTSAAYIINCPTTGTNCPVAVPASVLSYSYGDCELDLGTTLNQMYNTMWQQAAAEGITVVVATGDSGAAACDNPGSNTPAVYGLAVAGEASTPYDVAVGGTDFNDLNNPTTYWNNTAGTLTTAKGYIPEVAYNDTCADSIVYLAIFGNSATAESACNSVATDENDFLWAPVGGGGGVSNCTTPSGSGPSTCSGGYAKPPWQAGTGVPSDGKRDLPDVSLFAGDGGIQNYYVVCEADEDLGGAPCNPTAAPVYSGGTYYLDFVGEGGTSIGTQAFAGIVALVDQKLGGKQGNINPILYSLASGSTGSSVFNDVTMGTNAMPCTVISGTPGCTVTGSGYTVGILNGYSAGTGFDLATGLGSVNVGNLINNVASVGPSFYLYYSASSDSNPVITISSPGGSGSMSFTAWQVNGFTGTVSLACSGLPAGASCTFSPSTLTFTSATTNIPFTVTVKTAASGMTAPSSHLDRPIPLPALTGITVAVTFLFAVFLTMTVGVKSRWNVALASTVFAVLFGVVACGGGSSTTTGGGTTTGTPSATVSPTTLTFASQNTNTTSTAQSVTLSNPGTASLSLTSIAASGNFAESNNCATSVAASASCTIQVTFTPTSTGTLTGTLSVQDNASGSPQTVSLTGTGVSSGGSGNSGTPIGSSTVTLTATSGSVSSPLRFTLTVQ